MESTARLYQCVLCHEQVIICRKCDHGNIYCANGCAVLARIKSLKLARSRYQATFNGKRHNAARQARFRKRHKNLVTHHGSPFSAQHVPIKSLKNKTENTENRQQNTALTCCFCIKPMSDWIRNDFLRQRSHKKSTGLQAYPQAP